MNYFLVDNRENEVLMGMVADFLWDHGHTIYFNGSGEPDRLLLLDQCTRIILMHRQHVALKEAMIQFHQQMHMDRPLQDKIYILLCASGIYTNALPAAYLLFRFNGLGRQELLRCFKRCCQLKLF